MQRTAWSRRKSAQLAMFLAMASAALTGCQSSQQTAFTNPFNVPDRAPAPGTRTLAPGGAQPYYPGDPLPMMHQEAAAPLPTAPVASAPRNDSVVPAVAQAPVPTAADTDYFHGNASQVQPAAAVMDTGFSEAALPAVATAPIAPARDYVPEAAAGVSSWRKPPVAGDPYTQPAAMPNQQLAVTPIQEPTQPAFVPASTPRVRLPSQPVQQASHPPGVPQTVRITELPPLQHSGAGYHQSAPMAMAGAPSITYGTANADGFRPRGTAR